MTQAQVFAATVADSARQHLLATCIRELRLGREWTQQDLADRTGYALRTIGTWERVGPPLDRSKLRALDRVFDGQLLRDTATVDTPRLELSTSVSEVLPQLLALIDDLRNRLDVMERRLDAMNSDRTCLELANHA